jgi:hypothetical protein
MSNNGKGPDFGQMAPPGGRVTGMHAVVAVMCNCGYEAPVLVPFHYTGPVQIACNGCGTIFFVTKLEFDIKNPQNLKFGIGAVPPAIVRAPAGLDVSKIHG